MLDYTVHEARIYVGLAIGDLPARSVGLHPNERACVGPRAVPKRRHDFLRGRAVAKCLIEDVVGIRSNGVWILPDDRGVPTAYHRGGERVPICLSISHTQGLAASAIAPFGYGFFGLGVDVEHRIEEPRHIMSDFFTPHERALCDAARCWSHLDDACRNDAESPNAADTSAVGLRAAQIWALKEAGLKALGTGLRVSADTVQVVDSLSQELDGKPFAVALQLSESAVKNALFGAADTLTALSLRAWLLPLPSIGTCADSAVCVCSGASFGDSDVTCACNVALAVAAIRCGSLGMTESPELIVYDANAACGEK